MNDDITLCGHVCPRCGGCDICCPNPYVCVKDDDAPPDHDLMMPHLYGDDGMECPPNCPYRLYFEGKK